MARVRALAGVTVLCSWAKHFIVTVPLSTQERKMGTSDNTGGTHVDMHPIRVGGSWGRKEEVAILLVSMCYRNWRKAKAVEKS